MTDDWSERSERRERERERRDEAECSERERSRKWVRDGQVSLTISAASVWILSGPAGGGSPTVPRTNYHLQNQKNWS